MTILHCNVNAYGCNALSIDLDLAGTDSKVVNIILANALENVCDTAVNPDMVSQWLEEAYQKTDKYYWFYIGELIITLWYKD